MKNLIICLFVSVIIGACGNRQQDAFTLEGTIEGPNDSTKIFVSYLTQKNSDWIETVDSVYLINGRFCLKGNITGLTAGYLSVNNLSIPIYIEPATIKLNIDMENPYAYKLTGTSVEKDNEKLQSLLLKTRETYRVIGDSIIEMFRQIDLHNNNPAIADSLMQRAYYFKAQLTANAEEMDSLQLDFVVKHNKSLIAPHLLYIITMDDLIDHDTIMKTYNSLPESVKETLLGKLALGRLKEAELLLKTKDSVVGDIAPDFSRESLQGDTIKLSDFRNKNYVLLDFWASWCGPCLKQIPQIKNIQKTYGSRGLKIIGISLDEEDDEWHKTIDKYQMETYPQVMGYLNPGSYFKNSDDISVMYGVEAIPCYILMNKQGEILARWQYIGDEELAFIDDVLMNGTAKEVLN